MTLTDAKICRKCGTNNRPDNSYCRKCGAVLDITTAAINAQPKPVTPDPKGIRWRYVGVGIFVMLGLTSCFLGAAAVLYSVLDVGKSGLSGLVADLFVFIGFVGVLFLIAFGLGGVVMAWLSRRPVTKEVTIATVAVIALLGAAGSTLTADMLIVAGIVIMPSVAAAWLGTKTNKGAARGGMVR